MRVAVIGAGGIGAVLAAAAVRAGHQVRVAVRTPIESLQLVTPEGETTRLAVDVRSDPAHAGEPADLVVLTVKATDNPGAAAWLSVLAPPGGLVLAVQNGLDHEERLVPFIPPKVRVAPGLAYLAAERLAAGRVRHLAGRMMVVPAAVADEVSAALSPGIEVQGTDDMVTAGWQKLLGNLVANPLTALTMRRIDVINDPGMADVARAVLAEAVAVGQASGAKVDQADIERIVVGTSRYGSETGSSMLYDRMAGRPMEHQFLTGEVVRRGRQLGIPVPINSALLALLDALDRSL